MSLVITCYSPTGIAISADSRTTGTIEQQVPATAQTANQPPVTVRIPWVVSDNTGKLFCVGDRFAVGTWGEAFLSGLPIAHHMNDFIGSLTAQFTKTEDLADALLKHFAGLRPGGNLGFAVAGYDGLEPFVYELNVNTNSKKRWNWDTANNRVTYGAFYGGDWDIVGRLLGGNAQIAWALMNLQDAGDVTRHLIRATIDQMKFEARTPTVGGAIDTITVTSSRSRFLARK